MRVFFWIYGLAAAIAATLPGCATQTLVLTSNERAQVSLVDYTDSEGEGELLGETPLSIEVESLQDKYLRIWGERIHSQYWVLQPLKGDRHEISLRLEAKDITEETPEDPSIRINRQFRMLMRAYQALSAKEWENARDLAKQLMREVPEAAAPHVITGLTYLAEKQKRKARTSFLKAKNLDPDDRDIEELLRIAQ